MNSSEHGKLRKLFPVQCTVKILATQWLTTLVIYSNRWFASWNLQTVNWITYALIPPYMLAISRLSAVYTVINAKLKLIRMIRNFWVINIFHIWSNEQVWTDKTGVYELAVINLGFLFCLRNGWVFWPENLVNPRSTNCKRCYTRLGTKSRLVDNQGSLRPETWPQDTCGFFSRILVISFPYSIIIQMWSGRNKRLIGVAIVNIEAASIGRLFMVFDSAGYFKIKGWTLFWSHNGGRSLPRNDKYVKPQVIGHVVMSARYHPIV